MFYTNMDGVTEYNEEMPVKLSYHAESKREVIVAQNEGGCNSVAIDLLQLVAWLKEHRPELFNAPAELVLTKGT